LIVNRTVTARARRLPAEWERQDGVLLTWPHAQSDWASTLAQVEPVFVAIAREVAARERLLVCARDPAHCRHIKALLGAAGVPAARLRIEIVPSNDTWARDHGPITVIEADGPRLLDFVFNGWGGKFEAALDDRIPEQLCARGAFGDRERERVDFVLEGGGIESDGAGTLLTTVPCQFHPGRNRGWSRPRIEAELRVRLGVQRVLWLEHGHLEGDDTDSHIDTLARLCDPRTIAYVHCDDPRDAHFAELAAMEAELQAWRDVRGEPYTLVPLPWPEAKRATDGRRLPASYANFLVINGAVLVPTYRDAADLTALARIAGCFPGREVVGIDCLPLIEQGGSLHCLTMQFPAGTLARW
jgi:agmatine deiminase